MIWMRRNASAILSKARVAAFALAAAAMVAASGAAAETNSALPAGYATDELPDLPPSHAGSSTGVANASEADGYSDTDPSALTDFREPLAPYGTWVEHPTYGTVWVPAEAQVGPDFAPYASAGHWETTDEGEWLWVSDYDWGYVPFHYGRWVWISDVGWAWIPGRVYAPAWVVWRVGDGGYIGWAPMPPTYYWTGGVAVTLWVVPPAAYVFCPTVHVHHHHVHHYILHDHHKVKHAVGVTKPYKPANPTPGNPNDDYKPAQPTPGDAGVSPKSAASARGDHDPRAKAFARPDTTPRPKGSAAAPRGSGRSFTASPGSVQRVAPAPSRGASRSGGSFTYVPPAAPRNAAPGGGGLPPAARSPGAAPQAAPPPGTFVAPQPLPRSAGPSRQAQPSKPRASSPSPARPSPPRARPAPPRSSPAPMRSPGGGSRGSGSRGGRR